MLAYLTPQNADINICKQEILECRWMTVKITFLITKLFSLPDHEIEKLEIQIILDLYMILIKLKLSWHIYVLSQVYEVMCFKLLFSLSFQLNELMQYPEMHSDNIISKTIKDFLRNQMGLVLSYITHPITKKQMCLYKIENINIESIESIE